MIEITDNDKKATAKDIALWYKQNIAGTIIKHPQIGDIYCFNRQMGETRNKIYFKYLCLMFHIKELIETSTTNGKIAKPTKDRQDGALGFIYLYNKVKYENTILNVCINIMVTKDHKKILHIQFYKGKKL